jgi:hypothetical protein
MTMPNFLIIGAAKSGTTSLWRYLASHPQIYMSPIKEPKFFVFEGEDPDFRGPPPRNNETPWAVTDLEGYHELFRGVTKEIAVGEASAAYLYNEKAPHSYMPEAKLIAILRNPTERAYSHFLHVLSHDREPLSDFARALDAEEERVHENWWPDFYYMRYGFYHRQLSRYFELFRQDQIRVYLYEDLEADPLGMVQDMFGFLGVDDTFVPEVGIRYNSWGLPRNKSLHTFLLNLKRVKPLVEPLLPNKLYRRGLHAVVNLRNHNLVRPQLSPEVRGRLIEEYREDVLKLQDLIEQDLSFWLKPEDELFSGSGSRYEYTYE